MSLDLPDELLITIFQYFTNIPSFLFLTIPLTCKIFNELIHSNQIDCNEILYHQLIEEYFQLQSEEEQQDQQQQNKKTNKELFDYYRKTFGLSTCYFHKSLSHKNICILKNKKEYLTELQNHQFTTSYYPYYLNKFGKTILLDNHYGSGSAAIAIVNKPIFYNSGIFYFEFNIHKIGKYDNLLVGFTLLENLYKCQLDLSLEKELNKFDKFKIKFNKEFNEIKNKSENSILQKDAQFLLFEKLNKEKDFIKTDDGSRDESFLKDRFKLNIENNKYNLKFNDWLGSTTSIAFSLYVEGHSIYKPSGFNTVNKCNVPLYTDNELEEQLKALSLNKKLVDDELMDDRLMDVNNNNLSSVEDKIASSEGIKDLLIGVCIDTKEMKIAWSENNVFMYGLDISDYIKVNHELYLKKDLALYPAISIGHRNDACTIIDRFPVDKLERVKKAMKSGKIGFAKFG
ncbi:hypothetical protein ABK040_015948 [Willaertia magna]